MQSHCMVVYMFIEQSESNRKTLAVDDKTMFPSDAPRLRPCLSIERGQKYITNKRNRSRSL